MPVAHGQAAVGVTFETVSTRSAAVAVPETLLDPEQLTPPMFGWLIVKLPATVAAAGNETVPVA